jgi:stage II sporulation protein D
VRYPLRSFFILTLLSLTGTPGAHAAPTPPKGRKPASLTAIEDVRVLLGNFPRASISGLDLLLDGRQTLEGNVTFSLRCGTTSEGPFIDYGGSSKAGGRLEVSAPGGFLRLDGKLYRSRFTVIARGDTCAVINTVNLEKYLAGLINKEMVPSWPVEALKAQGVAARTYAVYQALQNRGKDYDLDSSVLDQVYDGAASETPRSTRVVEATKGEVLSFANQPLKAYFHANCGGMTEVPVAVWGSEDEAFRPVVCPYHQRKRDRQRWSFHVSRLQLEKALRKVSGMLPRGFARLARLEAGAPTPSQRLNDVVVTDAAGTNLVLSANSLRNALGNTKIKSTAFQIRGEGDGFRIDGEGFGHGVGMCQVGARAMAEEGKRYREILAYYYPLAELRRF